MAREKREVIVRGMTAEWFGDHFKDMKVYFGGLRAVPQYDSDFIGFYLEAPDSAITHIGVVDSIDRQANETNLSPPRCNQTREASAGRSWDSEAGVLDVAAVRNREDSAAD